MSRSSAINTSDSPGGRGRLRRELRRDLPERDRRARTVRSSSPSPSAPRSTRHRRRSCSTRRAGSPRASSGSFRMPRSSRRSCATRWRVVNLGAVDRRRRALGRDPDRAPRGAAVVPLAVRASARARVPRVHRRRRAAATQPVGAPSGVDGSATGRRSSPGRRRDVELEAPPGAPARSACSCSSPASPSSSWRSRSSAARSGSSSSQYTDVDHPRPRRRHHPARPRLHRRLRLRAEDRPSAGAGQRRAHRRSAARHRARHRLDAVHRPDARGDHVGVVEPRRPGPGRAARTRVLAGARHPVHPHHPRIRVGDPLGRVPAPPHPRGQHHRRRPARSSSASSW